MRILITTDVIHAGGAETFVLRLAQALQDNGHEVILYPLYANKIDFKIINVLAPKVKLQPSGLKAIRLLQVADGVLRRLRIDWCVLKTLMVQDLAKLLVHEKIELVHSHLFTADQVAVAAGAKAGVPVVTTIHGDYKNYYRRLTEGQPMPFYNYTHKLEKVVNQFAAFVYISEEQHLFFEEHFKGEHLPLYKIYNGYAKAKDGNVVSRKALRIPESAFVFGMVARGIPSKGWEEAIAAFLESAVLNSYLVLVGDSTYVQMLKEKHAAETNIIFTGYSANPIEYIQLFNAGLFTSTYYSESLPTVLIEYLFCGVAVIAVDVAECRNMMDTPDGPAGLIVPLEDGKVSISHFANAMRSMAMNKELQLRFTRLASEAAKKFDMQTCIEQYEKVYKKAIS